MSDWEKINDGWYQRKYASHALEVYTNSLGQWIALGVWPECGVELKSRYKTAEGAMRAAEENEWFDMMNKMSTKGLLVRSSHLPCG